MTMVEMGSIPILGVVSNDSREFPLPGNKSISLTKLGASIPEHIMCSVNV